MEFLKALFYDEFLPEEFFIAINACRRSPDRKSRNHESDEKMTSIPSLHQIYVVHVSGTGSYSAHVNEINNHHNDRNDITSSSTSFRGPRRLCMRPTIVRPADHCRRRRIKARSHNSVFLPYRLFSRSVSIDWTVQKVRFFYHTP